MFNFVHLDEVIALAEVATEAKELAEALHQVTAAMDDIITYTNKERATALIWQRMTDAEYLLIAQWIVKAATKSKAVATAIHKVKVVSKQLQLFKMLGVKVTLTWIFYGLHGGVSLPNVQELFEKMMQGNSVESGAA